MLFRSASQVKRSIIEQLNRDAVAEVVPNRMVFEPLLAAGQAVRALLPKAIKRKIPPRAAPAPAWPAPRHARRMLVLEGCAQPSLSPATNVAAARVLDVLGISLIRAPDAGCCGAVHFHLDKHATALDQMRRNIDAWWPCLEDGVERIVITASGCGIMVQDYAHALRHDEAYADKARRISTLACDISSVIAMELPQLQSKLASHASRPANKIAFHAPCTLQHGMKKKGVVEALLAELGFEILPVADAHLCCGSAGTYSILQPALSNQLRANKIAALEEGSPGEIVTANIGCQSHLQGATATRVRHWIELVNDCLKAP